MCKERGLRARANYGPLTDEPAQDDGLAGLDDMTQEGFRARKTSTCDLSRLPGHVPSRKRRFFLCASTGTCLRLAIMR